MTAGSQVVAVEPSSEIELAMAHAYPCIGAPAAGSISPKPMLRDVPRRKPPVMRTDGPEGLPVG